MSASYWWVNHSAAFPQEIEAGCLWFPKPASRSRSAAASTRRLAQLRPGDVIISHADGAIRAAGVVLSMAQESRAPFATAASSRDSRSSGKRAGASSGSIVRARFVAFENPVLVSEHLQRLSIDGQVGVSALPQDLVEVISGLLAGQLEHAVESMLRAAGRALLEDATAVEIQQRDGLDATRRCELLQARHGQGLFRANVELNEHECRLTGVLDRRHLRAVHIKPWFQCDEREMLDGLNGLLLSPHVAHLFERGYVSFADDGQLLISRELNPAVLEKWGFGFPCNAGPFRPEQRGYLEHHRREVFQQHGGGRRQQLNGHVDPAPAGTEAEPATVHPVKIYRA